MTFHRVVVASIVTVCFLASNALQAINAEEHPASEKSETGEQYAGMPEQQPATYRQHVKTAMQSHLLAFGLILTFRVPHEDHFEMHADALASLAAVHASLYPAGSETPGTSPLVWERADAFQAAAGKTKEAADRLRESLGTKNRHAILNQFVQLSESCEGCHRAFRKEQ